MLDDWVNLALDFNKRAKSSKIGVEVIGTKKLRWAEKHSPKHDHDPIQT